MGKIAFSCFCQHISYKTVRNGVDIRITQYDNNTEKSLLVGLSKNRYVLSNTKTIFRNW